MVQIHATDTTTATSAFSLNGVKKGFHFDRSIPGPVSRLSYGQLFPAHAERVNLRKLRSTVSAILTVA
jgi:hypothetical protein